MPLTAVASSREDTILVVDDSRLDRAVLGRMLEKMGYLAFAVSSGTEALLRLDTNFPDLILVDVYMPEMTGFELVQKIRNESKTWIPIIFISASTDNESILEGLRAGADDYLFKPVSYEILATKVEVLLERARTLAQVMAQNTQLLNYRALIHEEREMALGLMQQMSRIETIRDTALRFFLKPSTQFSGDLICAARAPDNKLNVLLADSAGHGLAAALASIPLTRSFYQMTARGFEIGAILREINTSIRHYLPLPRYVAAIMLSYDPLLGHLSVWNGGCPTAFLLEQDGTLIQGFKSQGLPLGVLPPNEFEPTLEHLILHAPPMYVLACTDGVSDLWPQEEGGLWGLVKQTLQHCPKLNLECMQQQIHHRLEAGPEALNDDVALILLQCEALPQHSTDDLPTDVPGVFSGSSLDDLVLLKSQDWNISLTLSAQRLRTLDVVPFLLGLVRQVEGENPGWQVDSNRLFMVLSELFNNAMDHGLLRLDSSLKDSLDGFENYFNERDRRLKALSEGEIHVHLSKDIQPSSSTQLGVQGPQEEILKIYFRDSGPGFDFHRWRHALKSNQQFHGRGLNLIRSQCSAVSFFGNGSEVLVQFKFTSH